MIVLVLAGFFTGFGAFAGLGSFIGFATATGFSTFAGVFATGIEDRIR